MKPDFDLQFLQYCDNEDLRALCDILMYKNSGSIRLNEQLSNTDGYLKYYPDNMIGMWKELASELQCYGGNTILNIFRNGRGPAYEKIVYDVCKKMHVKDISKYDTAEEMEQKLLIAVSAKIIEELDEIDIRNIMDECEIHDYAHTKAGLMAALVALQLINRKLFIMVLNVIMRFLIRILIGRGIMTVGIGLVSRGVGVFFGPVAWIVLGGWTAWDIMGPAYRVTIPAVVQVAYMRAKYAAKINLKHECV